jgi:putative methyltransferase (TIGR04325 family)
VTRNNKLCFNGDYQIWEDAVKASSGYAAANILEITREAMLKIRDGEAVYERDSVIFDKPEYPYPLLAGLMRIALSSGRLSVLDFGGALGSTYFQCRNFLNTVKDLRWSIVEQPAHVQCGQAEFINEHLNFYHSVKNCMENEIPNTLLLSSVLQYLPTPYDTLQELLSWRIPHVLIDRTAFVVGKQDRLTVQTVPESIYFASYPAWFFCEANFSRMLINAGYRIVDAFAGADHVPLDKGKSYFKGFILELDT